MFKKGELVRCKYNNQIGQVVEVISESIYNVSQPIKPCPIYPEGKDAVCCWESVDDLEPIE